MQVPFLFRAPYEVFIRENITFVVWFLLVLFGSLSGLIALSGSSTPLETYLLSGSYYITVISLSAVYISDTAIYLLDKHRQNEKMDSVLPIQILLIIICIFLIFPWNISGKIVASRRQPSPAHAKRGTFDGGYKKIVITLRFHAAE